MPHQASIIRSIALRLIRPSAHMNVYIDFFSRACGALFFSRRACGAQIPFQSIHIGHYKMYCGGRGLQRRIPPAMALPIGRAALHCCTKLLRRILLTSALPIGRAALYYSGNSCAASIYQAPSLWEEPPCIVRVSSCSAFFHSYLQGSPHRKSRAVLKPPPRALRSPYQAIL